MHLCEIWVTINILTAFVFTNLGCVVIIVFFTIHLRSLFRNIISYLPS